VPQLAKLNSASIPLMQQARAASSCQNETILPWTHDTIPDKTFPATGPVYQEAAKPLPGLAGESRTGDANGQWFDVLVSGGLYSVPNGIGGVMLTDSPLLGANPPAQSRPPLKPNVPCETQQSPDLRTVPQGLPVAHRAVVPDNRLAAYGKLVNKAVAQTRTLLKDSPIAKKLNLRVTSQPATLKDLSIVRSLRDRLLKGGR
jgi:hypothetical protein